MKKQMEEKDGRSRWTDEKEGADGRSRRKELMG